MLDVIFYLLINALIFLGIVAVAAMISLPFVRLFAKSDEAKEHGTECVSC